MRRRSLFPLLAVLTLAIPYRVFGGSQFWTTLELSRPLIHGWKLRVADELRFSIEPRELQVQYVEVGISRPISPCLGIELGYRHLWTRDGDRWSQEKRPQVDGTLRKDEMGLQFSDRNRLEYRILEDHSDGLRYRNKLTVSPARALAIGTKPFLAEEIFCEFDPAKLARNRFYAGLEARISNTFKTQAYYLLQSDKKETGWTSVPIVGLKMSIALK